MENGPQNTRKYYIAAGKKARKCYSVADGSPFWGVMLSRVRGCSRIPETGMWFCLHRPHARGMGWGRKSRPHGCAHMCKGWGNVSFSDGLGRDSRAFKSSAYMVICVDNSTGRIYGNYRAYRKINANGGRRCRQVQSVTAEKSAFRDARQCRGVRDPDAWSGMPWAVVSVPVWRSESQMPKVLKKFCFRTGISKKA